MNSVKIEYRRTQEIKPYANNPRINDMAVDKVAASIEAFGFKSPIIIDSNDVIICGHTRLRAAIQLGITEVPCIKADDLSEEQTRAFRLADNKVAERASWDEELLADELGCIVLNMAQFGFIIESSAAKDDKFDATLPSKPITELNDIWLLGRHRLMCGDSTDISAVSRLMDNLSADMLLTDPPYNVDYHGSDGQSIKNDSMNDELFHRFLSSAFHAADSALKPGAAIYVWHADSEGYNFRIACSDVGWKLRQCIIWRKNAAVMGRQDYHWQHEPCLYLSKPGAPVLWAGGADQTSVLNYDRPRKNKDHPTCKVVPMFDRLIQNNTRPMDIVLDTFAGSGTTMAACEQDGRTAYLMELDPRYADVIVKRYISLTNSSDAVFVIRGDKKLNYMDVVTQSAEATIDEL